MYRIFFDEQGVSHMHRLDLKRTVSLRIDDYTYQVINSFEGRNFSDRLRNYIWSREHSGQ